MDQCPKYLYSQTHRGKISAGLQDVSRAAAGTFLSDLYSLNKKSHHCKQNKLFYYKNKTDLLILSITYIANAEYILSDGSYIKLQNIMHK